MAFTAACLIVEEHQFVTAALIASQVTIVDVFIVFTFALFAQQHFQACLVYMDVG
jgi:ATP/ADP translocase